MTSEERFFSAVVILAFGVTAGFIFEVVRHLAGTRP